MPIADIGSKTLRGFLVPALRPNCSGGRAASCWWGAVVNRTRKLFPAVVSGVVIMAVGLELGKIAAGVLLEHTAAHSEQTVRLSRPPSAHLP